MSAPNTNAGGQTPPASEIPPQGQTPPTSGQTPTTPPATNEDDAPMSVAEARKLREELKQRRETEKAALAKLDEAERAKLSELEKAQKDAARHQQTATELQQKYQELLVRTAIKDKAAALHFHDPEDAFLHLMRGGELDFDDAGNPKNADKLLKALAEAKPYLVQTAEPQAQPGRTSPGATNPNRSAIGAQPVTNPRSLTWNDVLKRPS